MIWVQLALMAHTGGFTFAAPLITQDDFSLIKLDHKFTAENGPSVASSREPQKINTNANQVDIQNKVATGNSPQRPRSARLR
jgi:hypothetical protein